MLCSAPMTRCLVWVAILLAACGSTERESANDQRSEETGGEDRPPPDVDPGPRPEAELQVDVDPDGQVELRLENRGADPIEMWGEVEIEHRRGDAWQAVQGTSLQLRVDCDTEPSECIDLVAGAVFIPPPWLGVRAGEGRRPQCECADCPRVEAGAYRLVARSCTRAHRIESEPFALP